MKTDEFIALVAPAAQRRMVPDSIFASVTIAQAALESGWGKKHPVDKYTGQDSNNIFGVKGYAPSWTGPVVLYDSNEWENGVYVPRESPFRAYASIEESIEDHGRKLQEPRYAPVRAAKDPYEQCRQLQACGYATSPTYADKLISIIDRYDLRTYDLITRNELLREDGEKIIKILGALWFMVGPETQPEVHRLANEIRKVCGIPLT
jgi:lysozyme